MDDRTIPPYPANGWDWCPAHRIWHGAGEDCPLCRCDLAGPVCPADFGEFCPHCEGGEGDREPGDWGPDDVVGLGPEPSEDGWYLDLVRRADHPGNDSLGGWRDA